MNPAEPADLSLVEKARTGDLVAQDRLIRAYQGRIAAFVFALTGSAGLVEDLSQAIFLKMLLKLGQLREAGRFDAWLFRLARNVCGDHFRREKWRRLLVPFAAEHEEVAAAAPAEAADLEGLRAALQKLPVAQRELLVLLQEREWSYEELAAITGSTVSAVKSKLFRARAELKRLMPRE